MTLERRSRWAWTEMPTDRETCLPRISVVTPSFNQRPFIRACLESVIFQGYPNLEYIVVDGGSTDGSVDIIREYADHITRFVSEPDGGHYDAVNKGFAAATGDILAWLNSDDMYCPWALMTVGTVMARFPEVKWLSSLSPLVWDWRGFCVNACRIAGFSREALFDGCYLPGGRTFYGWIQQESTFFRRELWDAAGRALSSQRPLAADFDLWVRYGLTSDLFGIESPLGGFRKQYMQRSRQMDLYLSEARSALEEARPRRRYSGDSHGPRKSLLASVRHGLKTVVGSKRYSGKVIVSDHPGLPSSDWRIAEVQF